MFEQTIGNIEFLKFISIPVVAALVGWSTNLVAIKMLFYPVEPFGKPPYLGWQGILPSKAAKMGAITTDTTLSKLGTLREVFSAMKPEKIAEHLIQTIEPRIEDYVEWVMLEENPTLWNALPDMFKRAISTMVRRNLPETVTEMMKDIGENIEDLVDLKELVIGQLVADKRIVNLIFLECGKVEFKFIIRSGLYFGFLFGLVQMAVWITLQAWWILPLFGIIVGYATNWMALRIIFQPLNPQRIGPFVLQGLFLKRQKEVSEIWCGIVAKEIITVHNIIHNMLNGRKSARTQEILRGYIHDIIDKALGITKPLVQFTVGLQDYVEISHAASEKVIKLTSSAFNDPEFSNNRAVVVKELMQERMKALTPGEFQYLLRPAFQEDEMKLILLGAALGFLAGLAQLFFLFGGIGG